MYIELEKLSLEELGRLFPIIISDYNPIWAKLYLSERELIGKTLGASDIIRMRHIGSTAVPGMCAKPTIDILLEIRDGIETDGLVEKFRTIGYNYTPQPKDVPDRMMFMKGYTLHGFQGQAYHVHVRFSGDWDEPYFRDYLILHRHAAEEYGRLKRVLKETYELDREAYTQGKAEFIRRIMQQARKKPEESSCT